MTLIYVLARTGFRMRFLGSNSWQVWEWVGLIHMLNSVIKDPLTVCLSARPKGTSLVVTVHYAAVPSITSSYCTIQEKGSLASRTSLRRAKSLLFPQARVRAGDPRSQWQEADGRLISAAISLLMGILYTYDPRPRSLTDPWAKRKDSPGWVVTIEAIPTAWMGASSSNP